MTLESIKPEAVIAACAAVAGVIWKVITMMFGLHRRVEATEKELAAMKIDVARQYQAVRDEIHKIGAEAKAQHKHTDDKLDRLIERHMS